MASLNKVLLMGNLTRDPELRRTTTGTAVCRMGLAVNRRYTTAQGEVRDEPCYIDVDVWGRSAEACAQNLRKGSSAFVEGRLRMDQWEDKASGQKRSRLLIQAENVQFVGGARQTQAGANPFASDLGSPVNDGFAAPNRAANPPVASATMPAQPPVFEPIDIQDEDIPF